MMLWGRNSRSDMAVRGATNLPWVFGGLAVISSAASLAAVFYGG
jgi:hypothetical protein